MDKQDLFVAEEDDTSDIPQTTHSDIPEDPILRSIPLVHGSVPNRDTQSLHLLQFPGRPQKRTFAGQQLKAAIKPDSKVVQLKTPMDTSRFYDESRAEELGTKVEYVSLNGVLTDTHGSLYVGQVVNSGENQHIVLTPLDSSAQLRPSFKYIDDLDEARMSQSRQEGSVADPSKSSAVHVLQTASKPSTLLNTDGQPAGGMGSCLRHIKKFNEEDWCALSWRDEGDSATQRMKTAMENPDASPVAATTAVSNVM